jgi:hypothetical protein
MKRIGKAKINLETDLWGVDDHPYSYMMNRRLVETRADVKKFLAKYKKTTNVKRPTRRDPVKREEYFKTREEAKKHLHLFWGRIYKEVLAESFDSPIPLRKDHDFDHNSDWRFCLYKGIIYQFDKPGLSDEEMIRQITAYEGPAPETPAED